MNQRNNRRLNFIQLIMGLKHFTLRILLKGSLSLPFQQGKPGYHRQTLNLDALVYSAPDALAGLTNQNILLILV